MSTETRTRVRNQQGPCPIVIPVRALNARGNEELQWAITDGVYVFGSLDLDHALHNNSEDTNDGVFGVKPATQDSIQNLERIRIEGAAESESSSPMPVCSICLRVLSVGSEAIRMPNPCFHVYHQHCIIKWLNTSNTCPLCRRTI